MSRTSTEPRPPETALVRLCLNGPAMGARWSAVCFAPEDVDPTALAGAIAAALEDVEAQMSSWRPTSDVERLNRTPVGTWTAIPARLVEVLEAALAIGDLSDGAFDVGVGDLVRAWGFGGGARGPDRDRIAAAGRVPFTSPKTLDLDPVGGRARRLAAGTIDLSGIAKGYGVDRMADVMADFGIGSFLVGIDGEMRAGGRKPDGRAWTVGRERPDRDARTIDGVFELVDAAVASSGIYRHVVEIDGRSVSHTMDPRRGAPLDGDLAQATVIAERCMIADAWATALLVAGAERGLALARRAGLAAVLVGCDGTVSSTI